MLYGSIPGIAKPISRLVQGTVMVSSGRWDEGARLLDAVFELGCTCFDTAHAYGSGDNERAVGRWIRERGIRDRVVILGKGAHPYDGRNRVAPGDISSDLSESLERFGTDHIDLYLLHRDDPEVPVGEIVDALNEHRAAGRIGAFGGSNWTHGRIEAANEYARSRGLTPFAASSPQFGLAYPCKPVWEGCVTIGGPGNEEAREWYRTNAPEPSPPAPSPYPGAPGQGEGTRVALLPWSSLGAGIFSGRFSRDNVHTFTEYLDRVCAECYGHEENFLRLDRARELAASKGATPAQIALAWLFGQGMNVFALVGCSRAAEFAENAEGFEIGLSAAEMETLEHGGPK